MNEFYRTPEYRFQKIIDYNFKPNYIDDLEYASGGRMHYVDEGSGNRGIALCLHGNTTWGYCYRKMIDPLVNSGYRVIIPDLIGFGRSDKPIDQNWHSYYRHKNIIQSFIKTLDLNNILLICHDWGGIIGLSIVPEMPKRFNKVLLTNTMIYTGESLDINWNQWIERSNKEEINLTNLIQSRSSITANEDLSAYEAPYPNWRYRAALKAFPNFIVQEDFTNNQKTLEFWTNHWEGQTFMAIGMRDYMMADHMMNLSRIIKHCKEPMIIEEAGHYVTEWGERIIKKALTAFG